MNKPNEPTLSFQITCSKDFLNKLLQEYQDFDKQHLNPRHAVNCAITSWHLTDWTYHEFFALNSDFQDEQRTKKNGKPYFKSGLAKYQDHLIKKCSDLKYMKLIANGTKHCILNDRSIKSKSAITEGHFSTAYSRFDYEVPKFIIELNEKDNVDFEEALVKTMGFWKTYIENL